MKFSTHYFYDFTNLQIQIRKQLVCRERSGSLQVGYVVNEKMRVYSNCSAMSVTLWGLPMSVPSIGMLVGQQANTRVYTKSRNLSSGKAIFIYTPNSIMKTFRSCSRLATVSEIFGHEFDIGQNESVTVVSTDPTIESGGMCSTKVSLSAAVWPAPPISTSRTISDQELLFALPPPRYIRFEAFKICRRRRYLRVGTPKLDRAAFFLVLLYPKCTIPMRRIFRRFSRFKIKTRR